MREDEEDGFAIKWPSCGVAWKAWGAMANPLLSSALPAGYIFIAALPTNTDPLVCEQAGTAYSHFLRGFGVGGIQGDLGLVHGRPASTDVSGGAGGMDEDAKPVLASQPVLASVALAGGGAPDCEQWTTGQVPLLGGGVVQVSDCDLEKGGVLHEEGVRAPVADTIFDAFAECLRNSQDFVSKSKATGKPLRPAKRDRLREHNAEVFAETDHLREHNAEATVVTGRH